MYCSLFRKYSYRTAINAGFLITIYLMLSGLRHFSRSLLSASQWASILQLIPLGAEVGSVRHEVPAITNICSKHIGDCNTCAGKYQASSSLTFVWRSDWTPSDGLHKVTIHLSACEPLEQEPYPPRATVAASLVGRVIRNKKMRPGWPAFHCLLPSFLSLSSPPSLVCFSFF